MKKWILRLVVLGILGFALLELVLWTLFPVGTLHPVSLRLENELPGFSSKSRVTLDSNGVRSYGYENGEKKVLCLGSDNTIALLQSTPDTWWAIATNEAGGDVGVAAWGVPGGLSLINYRFLLGNIETLEPDVVVFVVSPIERLALMGFEAEDESILDEPLVFGAPGWRRSVLKVSQTARRLRNLVRSDDGGYLRDLQGENVMANQINGQHQVYREAALTSAVVGQGDPDGTLETVIKRTKALCDEHGAELIVVSEPIPQEAVMTQSEQNYFGTYQLIDDETGKPVPVRVDPGVLKTEYEQFLSNLSKTCEGNGVQFVPLHEELSPAAPLFLGDRYLNDQGQRAFAEALVPHLKKTLE